MQNNTYNNCIELLNESSFGLHELNNHRADLGATERKTKYSFQNAPQNY